MSELEKSVTSAQVQPKSRSFWLPIKTAPKTGETILLWDSKHKYILEAFWDDGEHGDDGEWVSLCKKWSGQASHWMPEPTAPEE